MSTNPVLDVVSVDYIRLATWDFKAYLDLAAIVRLKYAGWRKSKWLQYTMQRSQDNVSYGLGTQKDQGHGIFEASGQAAHEFTCWLLTSGQVKQFLPKLYATRIDLQCTKQRHDNLDYVKTHKSIRKPKQLILGDDGNTLYIGNRESNSFWRLYDKTKDAVRLEVEFKGQQAKNIWLGLQQGVDLAALYHDKLKRSRVPKYLVDHYTMSHEVVDWTAFAQKEPEDLAGKLKWLATLDGLVFKLANDHDVGERTAVIIKRWYEYTTKD